MKYPRKLENNDIVGITAPSAGVGKYIDEYYKSVENIKNSGFKVIETESVKSKKEVSSSKKQRVKELNDLLLDDNVKAIICATGGDFLYEIMPYIDFNLIEQNPKWIMGASDPTYLLYVITTKLDIATIYGHNASSFDAEKLHISQQIALNTLKGIIEKQKSYDYYESNKEGRINNNYNLDSKVKWESNNNEIDVTGRIIGGCIDCLKLLPGTKYDNTKYFIEKYKNDGIIWYFDIFSLSSEEFYLTLLQLNDIEWFKYIKAVIVGRVKYPSTNTTMTYEKALKKVFKNIPIIYNADIGHVPPKMTIINGSVANIKYKNNKGIITQYFK